MCIRDRNNTMEKAQNISNAFNSSIFSYLKTLIINRTTKELMKNIKIEIIQIVDSLGFEGEIYLFTSLLQLLNYLPSSQGELQLNHKKRTQRNIKQQMLVELLSYYSPTCQFVNYFAQILEIIVVNCQITEYLSELFKALKLSIYIEVILCYSAFCSENTEIKKEGKKLLSEKLAQINEQPNKEEINLDF
eukprot:TRINITY_DN9382_c0_g2_i1.p1 TRINITY_DN9382_c0_g2~~TRINITY_DN9382_c0_g2_i1.p1  ORF type:complete len:190 (-),score=37.40 TRINITY_DN9382_c0_g2_i1:370-939(-)